MGFQKFKFLGDLVVIQQYKKGNFGDEVVSISNYRGSHCGLPHSSVPLLVDAYKSGLLSHDFAHIRGHATQLVIADHF